MKKFSLPKINLSKKSLIIISSSVVLVILLVIILSIVLKKPSNQNSLAQTIDRGNTAGLELADDSSEAKSDSLQKSYATKDGYKIKVYGETTKHLYSSGNQGIIMMQSCQYEGEASPEETNITLGATPIEVDNHCNLTFEAAFDSSDTVDTLNAYILLPDNSMIVASSNHFTSLQVNMYKNETRVVQITGEAYYRIAPQGDNKIFTVQMLGEIFTATGTELYTELGFANSSNSTFGINKDDLTGGFFLYEGNGYLTDRGSNDVIQNMSSSDNSNVFYMSFAKFVLEKIPGVTDAIDVLGRGDFLTNQKALSEQYGFGNFKQFTTDKLNAFVYDNINKIQTQSVSNVEKKYKEINDEWEALQAEHLSSSTSSGGSSNNDYECVSSGASYQLCSMAIKLGSAHMSGGKCCFDSKVEEPQLVPVD